MALLIMSEGHISIPWDRQQQKQKQLTLIV